jgi:putative acetyltransferase
MPSCIDDLVIHPDDLRGAQTRDLLRLHLLGMRAHSPPGSVFALDLSGLERPEIAVWSAWHDGRIAGIAALKALDPAWGEVKSMRVHPDFLGRGVGLALLDHIIDVARARGYGQLSLETGTGPAFAPALTLYRKRGFVAGGSFGGYPSSDFNCFLHLRL